MLNHVAPSHPSIRPHTITAGLGALEGIRVLLLQMNFEQFLGLEAVHFDSIAVFESTWEECWLSFLRICRIILDMVVAANVLAEVVFAFEPIFAAIPETS